jgi:hypothetical protein
MDVCAWCVRVCVCVCVCLGRRRRTGVLSACGLLVFIWYEWTCVGVHCYRTLCNLTAAMPDKRMRPIAKQEPGTGGAQELLQQQQAESAAGERDGQHRRVEDDGGVEFGLQLLRANAEVHAVALQWMEREMAMGEQLLQAKAQVTELRAAIMIKDATLQAKDAALKAKDSVHKAEVALLESKLQSKEAALQTEILGRYAAPGKHLVGAPYSAASNLNL